MSNKELIQVFTNDLKQGKFTVIDACIILFQL